LKNEKNFFLASSDNLILNLYIGSNLLAIKKLEKKIVMSQERLKKIRRGETWGY